MLKILDFMFNGYSRIFLYALVSLIIAIIGNFMKVNDVVTVGAYLSGVAMFSFIYSLVRAKIQ